MKKMKRIMRKTIMKAVTFIAFLALSVIYFISIPLFFVYRFTMVPMSVIGFLLMGYELVFSGFTVSNFASVLLCAAVFALQFAGPCLIALMVKGRKSMRFQLNRPIIVRHRWRFVY